MTAEVTQHAKNENDITVFGAPNVLRGGSHTELGECVIWSRTVYATCWHQTITTQHYLEQFTSFIESDEEPLERL